MKRAIVFICAFAWCLISAGQVKEPYDGVQAIKEIHEGWLIIRLPGFEKKLGILDSLMNNPDLTQKSRRVLEKERARTLEAHRVIHEWYPKVFDSTYTFSKVAFISTHESEGFQSGRIPVRTSTGETFDSIHLTNYFFATLDGSVGDRFVFTTKDHRILAYPFPNNIAKPGNVLLPLFMPAIPMWAVSYTVNERNQRRAYRHVVRVNRRLSTFYRRKYLSD